MTLLVKKLPAKEQQRDIHFVQSMAVHYNQQDEHARLLEQRQGQDYEAGRQQGNENDGGPQGQPEYASDDEHRVPDPPADIDELRRRIQRLEELLARKRPKWCICSIIISLFAVAIALAGCGWTAAEYFTPTNEQRNNSAAYYNLSSSEETKHATYEMIGSENCGRNATFIYTGMTVGFKTGTGTNFQCMPTEHVKYYEPTLSNYTISMEKVISGKIVKYKTFRKNKNDLVAACALCRIDGRETIETLPATHMCADSWTKQYEGYLMTGGICVHVNMVGEKNRNSSIDYLTLHHEVLREMGIPPLLYSPYKNDLVLSCVVCSR